MKTLIDIAHEIASECHEKHVCKAGRPYMEHVTRVALHVDTFEEKIVALLHDVLEDGTDEDAHRVYCLMPDAIIESVRVLTRRKGTHAIGGGPDETRAAYYERVATSGDMRALNVKLADLKDHLRDTSPISEEMVRTYAAAYEKLTAAAIDTREGRFAKW